MILSGYWLALALFLPLFTAIILMVWPNMRRAAMAIAPWSALPALSIALIPMDFATIKLPGLLLGTQIGLDETSRYFLLLAALVWLTAGLYAKRSFATPEQPGFFILFLLAMVGNLGAIIASGILSFYFFFALMSFAAYGLVIHKQTPEVLRAGRIYMVFVVLGEVMLLSALMLAASESSGYDFESIRTAVAESEHRNAIILLTVMGLGIKIGLPGLHFTLPLIYRAAPIPAAVVLAGAMVNAGLLGWLRLLPAGEVVLAEWSTALMALGLFAAFYGVLVGLTQRDAKTLLAYSSISQMGILTFAVGLGLGAPQAWPQILMVITLYAVHHGLAKGALFLGVGVAQNCPDSRHWRWLVGLGLLLPALALAGAPLTSGMLAKGLLKEELGLAPWPEALGWLLTLSSLTTTLLVARFVYLAWPRSGDKQQTSAPDHFPSWLLLLAASLLVVWFLPRPTEVELLSLSVWWKSLWPVLFGIAIAVIAAKFIKARRIRVIEIPVGDLLVPLESISQKFIKALAWLTAVQLPRWQQQLSNSIGAVGGGYRGADKTLALIETKLANWPIAVILLLTLIVALVLWS